MAKQEQKKPNILVIWGDDIGWSNLSCYNLGVMGYRTPNIDRLAKEGALFTDAYGEQSCTAGSRGFYPRSASCPHRAVNDRYAGLASWDHRLDADDCRFAQTARLHHRPVR